MESHLENAPEKYLEKKVFVYRKYYAFYFKISKKILVSKFLFSSSGLSAFEFVLLAALSIGATRFNFPQNEFL
jgi:hypothetical protein